MAILLAGGYAAYPSPARTRKPDREFYVIVRPMDTGSLAEAGSEYVERARGLAPQIEACAHQIEQERRLTGPVLDALFEAGEVPGPATRPPARGQGDPTTLSQ